MTAPTPSQRARRPGHGLQRPRHRVHTLAAYRHHIFLLFVTLISAHDGPRHELPISIATSRGSTEGRRPMQSPPTPPLSSYVATGSPAAVDDEDALSPGPAAALSAVLDRPSIAVTSGDPLPPLWQWLCFLDGPAERELGPQQGCVHRSTVLPPPCTTQQPCTPTSRTHAASASPGRCASIRPNSPP